MAQLRDTIVDGNLEVTGSLNVADATINGETTFTEYTEFHESIVPKKGSYIHHVYAGGTSGYIKIAQIKIGYEYANTPIQIKTASRGYDCINTYTIRFVNSNTTDPDVSLFTHSMYAGYLVKSATSTWDLYIQTNGSYDDNSVMDVLLPFYARDLNRINITWTSEVVTTLPDGHISSGREEVIAKLLSVKRGNSSANASGIDWGGLTIVNTDFSTGADYGVGIKLSNNSEGSRKWVGIGAVADNAYSNQTSMSFYVSSSPDTSIDAYRMVYDRFKPNGNDVRYLGDSVNKWKSLYAVTGTIQTSDRNKKENIVELDEKYESLFNQLKPVTYDFKGDNHDRTHVGFISQDIEDSLSDVGLTAMDFAGFCKDIKKEADEEGNEHDVLDENGNPVYEYALRYEEFIALNTHMIQKANAKIAEQQSEIDTLKEMVYALKSEVDELKSNK